MNNTRNMRYGSAVFLQAVTILIGIAVLAFMLVEPHHEGRNLHATFFEIYFTDPFLAYAYIASIPFFIGLYQAFKILGHVRRNAAGSPKVLKALETIRHCAIAIIGFVMVGEIIFILFNNSDDRAGGVAMGFFIIVGSLIAAAVAALFERILQRRS